MEIRFEHLDAAGAQRRRDTVAAVHADAYAEKVGQGDAFAQDEAFMARFDAYTERAGFDLVLAYDESRTPIGQAWGWPLDADTRWWSGLVGDHDPDLTVEDGTRTFVLAELMVGRAWTGQGIAHALHDELLGARREERAVLLVRPDNDAAYAAYRRWGWRKMAQLRPSWPDAPLFDVLTLPAGAS